MWYNLDRGCRYNLDRGSESEYHLDRGSKLEFQFLESWNQVMTRLKLEFHLCQN